jgi:hypothetical protein
VIDGQRRKFNQMNNRRNILAHAGNQTVGRDLLMTAGNRQHHAPMAAENVRMPRSSAFGLQPFRMRRAERPQAGKSREYDAFFGIAPLAGTLPDHRANQRAILVRTHRPSGGIESGVEKKLPRRAHNHKAPVRIGWFWLPAMKRHPARRRIKPVFPDQFVGIGKGIGEKIESPGSTAVSGAIPLNWGSQIFYTCHKSHFETR